MDALVYQRSYFSKPTKFDELKFKFIDDLTVNLSKQLRSLPQIIKKHWIESSSGSVKINVHKVYNIHLIIESDIDGVKKLNLYRLSCSRKGIHLLESLK